MMDITKCYHESRSERNASGIKSLQSHTNRKNRKDLDFPKQLYKGRFRIQNIAFKEKLKPDYGDNEGPS